jgi:hypothetical protein
MGGGMEPGHYRYRATMATAGPCHQLEKNPALGANALTQG